MPSAAILRRQIEATLANRIPSALTSAPRTILPVAATGIRTVDDLLEGGLPLGAITEIVGPECSGRTSLALSFLAQMTQAEKVCAWIDVSDALDPESAAAVGVDLSRLLWVRCGVQIASQTSPSTQRTFSLPEKYLVAPPTKKGLHGGGFGSHPRNEVKGLSDAVNGLLKPEALAPRCAEPQRRERPEKKAFEPDTQRIAMKHSGTPTVANKPWNRIEQALSTTDLLLQGGGFSAIVLDMGGIAPEHAWLPHQYKPEPTRLPVLCESREGYQNLCQLITQFKMRDGEEAGRETVKRLIRAFGRENVYVELQRHREREEEWRNQAAIRIAQSLKLPMIATNGVRYATAYDREILDLFTAIRYHVELDQAGRLLALNSLRYLRPAREMDALFRDVPGAIENTIDLSSRLKFELSDLGYKFPHYPVPDGEIMDSFLRKRVEEGVQRRYGPKSDRDLMERAKRQVEKELALIANLGFAGYFLIVWDIVQYCKRNDILIQGRGSAANSAVCYVLEITAVDPVGMELLFERFLSESRNEWPDIDLDLPSEEKREQAIQYLYKRFGELGAAMTANVTTYRQKSAARETGKALGLKEDSLSRLASLAGQWEWRGKTDTMAHSFVHAGFDIRDPRIAKHLELSMRIQDLPRNLSQHSGGMVICQGQLNRIVPLERASMQGRTVVQWDKEDCADLGIIKVDLLGLGMMAVIEDCLELIPEHYGEKIDLARLPEDDEVYRTLQKADTVGMFQVESRAQMASLPRNHPERFYDLVVQVAIIRPGLIVGQMMHPYMRRRQKKENVTYPHPLIEPVLKRTLGVPLFQEQLLRMAMTVANFSGAEADELRRAVGMRVLGNV